MNKSIRVTALFSILLTIVLLINLTIVQAFSVDKYAENPKNQRNFYDMQTIARGQIFAGGPSWRSPRRMKKGSTRVLTRSILQRGVQ